MKGIILTCLVSSNKFGTSPEPSGWCRAASSRLFWAWITANSFMSSSDRAGPVQAAPGMISGALAPEIVRNEA